MAGGDDDGSGARQTGWHRGRPPPTFQALDGSLAVKHELGAAGVGDGVVDGVVELDRTHRP